jgi:hypothetical protein
MVVMTSHVDNDRSHDDGLWGCATDPSTLTEGFDYMDGTVAVALAYGLKSSAGSTGDGTATLSGAEDNDGILFALKPCSSGGNYAPTAPTTPYLNNTTAQSGQATPATGITDPTPAFSAIYSDPDSGDIANKFRVEVNTQSDFGGTTMWDSGSSGTAMPNTTESNRCADIIYAGSPLADSTTYYWRITFWDDSGEAGAASATQQFTTGTLVGANAFYYSVGIDNGALYNNTASASSGTLTLDSAADNKIGVGDEVRVGSNRYYITGRNSSTEFTIQNSAANSGTPGDTNITFTTTGVTIYRAFNSLSAAVANSNDNTHLNTVDLVANNYQLNWACYGDGADTTQVTVSGWTTGTDNYIKIYTPTSTSEVGTTQRHSGVWSASKYSIETTASPIHVQEENVRIEGLQIKTTAIDGNGDAGIEFYNVTGVADYRVSSNIIQGVTNNTYTYNPILIYTDAGSSGSVARIWNNIIYDFDGSNARGVRLDDADFTAYVYNNTIHNCTAGFRQDAGTFIAKNNIYQSNGISGADGFVGTFTSSDYNISDLASRLQEFHQCHLCR